MNIPTILLAVLAGFLLSACEGGDSEPSRPPSSSSSSSSSSGGCNYDDKISATERNAANKCGIQVSGNYAQADSGLQSVIAACQRGEKAKADAYYSSTYMQMVTYARDVAKTLSCNVTGSTTSPTGPTLPDNSVASFYNFCVKQTATAGKITYSGNCSGPYKQFTGGCPSGFSTNVGQYSSMDACTKAGQAWLNAR